MLVHPEAPRPNAAETSLYLSFRERGFLVVKGLLDAHELTAIRDMIADVVEDYERQLALGAPAARATTDMVNGSELISVRLAGSRTVVQYEPGHDPRLTRLAKVRKVDNLEDCPAFDADPCTAKTAVVAAQLLAEPVRLVNKMVMLKPSGGIAVPWHQDSAYLTIAPPAAVLLVWTALEPATVDNGCLRVIEGGHRLGPLPHSGAPRGAKQANVVVSGGIAREQLPLDAERPIELDAGDAVAMLCMVPHSTEMNRSLCSRNALQLHWCSASATKLSLEEYFRSYPGFYPGAHATHSH